MTASAAKAAKREGFTKSGDTSGELIERTQFSLDDSGAIRRGARTNPMANLSHGVARSRGD